MSMNDISATGFLIFGGQCFYASGGANDFICQEPSLHYAIKKAKELIGKNAVTHIANKDDLDWDSDQYHTIEWVHVIDYMNKIVYESDEKPLGGNRVLKITD